MADQIEAVDFALAAYREEGAWTVQELVPEVLDDVEGLVHALRRGVAIAPGAYEVLFVGTAHTDAVLDQIVEAFADAAREVAAG